jgi:reactive intermediate/imine deaminase
MEEYHMGNYEVIDPWNLGSRYTFSQAVKKGNMLFISGMTASDPKTGEVVGEGDIVAQTRFIYEKMGEILKAVGASFDDIVRTDEYITTMENYKETAKVRRELFGDEFPAATGVVVKRLLRKEALIEINAIAVLST